MRQHRGEEGVSEVIGVMLLVGMTVLAVAIVAVVLLSGSQPDEIPQATIVAGNESGRLALVHEGGDPLREGEYRIYVDTGSGLMDGTRNFTEPEDGVWSIGGTLAYNGTEKLKRVVVTAISGGSETILAEPEFVGRGEGAAGFSPDPVEPGVTPVSPGTPGSVTPPSSPILITKPLIQGEIDLKNFNCTANITDANVTRVDLLVYDFNETKNNNKATVYTMSNSSSSPCIYQKAADIQGNPVKKGNYAAITVIAYNGSKAIGHDTIVVKSKS
jgi:FlaG/FlaF family flagellin (archaellin)